MSRYQEVLSPEGFRLDGRRPKEVRHVSCTVGGMIPRPNGMATLNVGNTSALACVYAPASSFPGKSRTVECHYFLSHGATRHLDKGRFRPSTAKSAILHQIFSYIVLTEKYRDQTIHIYVYILDNDGGDLATAINATCLALVDAGIHMRDLLAACTLGSMGKNQFFVDLNEFEAQSAVAEMTLAITKHSHNIILMDLSSRLSEDDYNQAQELGVKACVAILDLMQKELLQYAQSKEPIRIIVKS